MRFFLISPFVAALAINFAVPAHAAGNDDFECHVHMGHDLDVIEVAPPKEVGGEQGYKVVSQIPDGSVFPCFRSDPSREGYMRITPSHGHERWVRLTAVNEGSKDSGGDFDAVPKGTFEKTVAPKLIVPPTDDKPYILQKRQVYPDSVNQRLQIFDAAGKSWKNPTDEDKRLFVDVIDGVAHDHKTGGPVSFVVEDTQLVPNFEDPVTGAVSPRLFYHIAEVPTGKVQDYLNGKQVDGVNYGWINSDHLREDKLPGDFAGCKCTTEVPEKSPTDQVAAMGAGLSKVMKDFEDRIANEAPICPAKKSEVLNAKPERADGRKIASDGSKNTVHRFLDKLSNFFRSKKDLGEKPTLAQRKAIDVLARTLLGEGGDCDERYAMAIARVAFNRTQNLPHNIPYDLKHGLISSDVASEDFKSKQNGLSNSMIEVLSQPAQLQAWDSDKPTSANMICVGRDRLSQQVFRRDYKIATEVIMNTENFKKETDSLAGVLNYAVGSVKPAWNCQRIKKQMKVHGLPVDNNRCFVPYDC